MTDAYSVKHNIQFSSRPSESWLDRETRGGISLDITQRRPAANATNKSLRIKDMILPVIRIERTEWESHWKIAMECEYNTAVGRQWGVEMISLGRKLRQTR